MFNMENSKKLQIAGALVASLLVAGGGVFGYTQLQARDTHVEHVHTEASYTCPMHPQIQSDKPGECPLCGMDLVKAEAPAASQAQHGEAALPAGLQEVVLSPEQVVLANVKTEDVQKRTLSAAITAPSKITYDETRLSQITAWLDGRIEKLYVSATGDRVTKGQPIGTLYSPEAVATMQEYLVALRSYQQMRKSEYPDLVEGSKSLLEASRQRLKLWGITDAQIKKLEKTQSPTLALAVNAPASGVVLKKLVQPGQYVKTGDVLYEVADLSKVWAEADVFEVQMKDVKVGHRAVITSPSYPGKSFVGKVSFVYPFLNPETRSMKVRVELSNPDGLLKPDMFVTASLRAPESQALSVPASAVLDTGKRQVVYVETAPGHFRPREVSLGGKAMGYYPVLSGLTEGEKVATSGGFLIDANSQIQAGFGIEASEPVPSGHEGH
jgi:Cu(I)/Ag(I) efflux system membrane fusion protein